MAILFLLISLVESPSGSSAKIHAQFWSVLRTARARGGFDHEVAIQQSLRAVRMLTPGVCGNDDAWASARSRS